MKTDIYTPNERRQAREMRPIHGECLERAGLRIPNKAYAIIDCSITPKVGDLVHCDNEIGTIHGYIKQVKAIEGETVIVGTAYENECRDYTFAASVIYGVVTEAFDKLFGNRVYCRDNAKTEKEGE